MALSLYFDESGYTGEDLLNADQPIFALAATSVSEELAQELRAEYFDDSKASELKHSDISSRPKGQKRIAAFIRRMSEGRLFVTDVWHKEFGLFSTLVDFWVEESTRLAGIDLYDKGANLGLANLTYVTFLNLLPVREFRMLMLQYQTMMRSRSRASYETFWGHMKRLFDVSDGPLRDAFVWFLGAERDLGFPHLTASPAGALTITKSSLFTSVAHWRKKLGGPFKVVHDSSSALSKEKDIWQLILGPELPKAEIGYDRRKVIFPLNVEEVVFADSKSHATLQLADIVAGATATFFRSRLDDAYRRGYAQLLKEAGITEMIQGVVWPSTAVTPEEMGTEGGSTGSNLADFLATQMKRAGVRPS